MKKLMFSIILLFGLAFCSFGEKANGNFYDDVEIEYDFESHITSDDISSHFLESPNSYPIGLTPTMDSTTMTNLNTYILLDDIHELTIGGTGTPYGDTGIFHPDSDDWSGQISLTLSEQLDILSGGDETATLSIEGKVNNQWSGGHWYNLHSIDFSNPSDMFSISHSASGDQFYSQIPITNDGTAIQSSPSYVVTCCLYAGCYEVGPHPAPVSSMRSFWQTPADNTGAWYAFKDVYPTPAGISHFYASGEMNWGPNTPTLPPWPDLTIISPCDPFVEETNWNTQPTIDFATILETQNLAHLGDWVFPTPIFEWVTFGPYSSDPYTTGYYSMRSEEIQLRYFNLNCFSSDTSSDAWKKPFVRYYHDKFGIYNNDDLFFRTNEAELFDLTKSITSWGYSSEIWDRIEITFQTTSSNEIRFHLDDDQSFILSPEGNTDFTEHTIVLDINGEYTPNYLQIEGLLEAEKGIWIDQINIKRDHWKIARLKNIFYKVEGTIYQTTIENIPRIKDWINPYWDFVIDIQPSDFPNHDPLKDLIIPPQTIYIEFYFDNIWYELQNYRCYDIELSWGLRDFGPPSEFSLKVNGVSVTDLSRKGGYVIFSNYQETVTFTSSETIYFTLDYSSDLQIIDQPDLNTQTYLTHFQTLTQGAGVILRGITTRNITGIRHFYLNGFDYGAVSEVSFLNIPIEIGTSSNVELILSEEVYRNINGYYNLESIWNIISPKDPWWEDWDFSEWPYEPYFDITTENESVIVMNRLEADSTDPNYAFWYWDEKHPSNDFFVWYLDLNVLELDFVPFERENGRIFFHQMWDDFINQIRIFEWRKPFWNVDSEFDYIWDSDYESPLSVEIEVAYSSGFNIGGVNIIVDLGDYTFPYWEISTIHGFEVNEETNEMTISNVPFTNSTQYLTITGSSIIEKAQDLVTINSEVQITTNPSIKADKIEFLQAYEPIGGYDEFWSFIPNSPLESIISRKIKHQPSGEIITEIIDFGGKSYFQYPCDAGLGEYFEITEYINPFFNLDDEWIVNNGTLTEIEVTYSASRKITGVTFSLNLTNTLNDYWDSEIENFDYQQLNASFKLRVKGVTFTNTSQTKRIFGHSEIPIANVSYWENRGERIILDRGYYFRAYLRYPRYSLAYNIPIQDDWGVYSLIYGVNNFSARRMNSYAFVETNGLDPSIKNSFLEMIVFPYNEVTINILADSIIIFIDSNYNLTDTYFLYFWGEAKTHTISTKNESLFDLSDKTQEEIEKPEGYLYFRYDVRKGKQWIIIEIRYITPMELLTSGLLLFIVAGIFISVYIAQRKWDIFGKIKRKIPKKWLDRLKKDETLASEIEIVVEDGKPKFKIKKD